MLLLKELIPKGCYCYTSLGMDLETGIQKIRMCPFYSVAYFYGIPHDYCMYINYGGDIHYTNTPEYQENYDRLERLFLNNPKLEKEYNKMFGGLCFSDQCKMCGVNENLGKKMKKGLQKNDEICRLVNKYPQLEWQNPWIFGFIHNKIQICKFVFDYKFPHSFKYVHIGFQGDLTVLEEFGPIVNDIICIIKNIKT